jgi:type I restriction enzyme, S subunit
MNNGWKLFKLKDICEQITDGKHGDCMNESNSGFYFLSAKDIGSGNINYDNARQITKADFYETHKRTKFEPLDILFTNN